MIKKQNHINLIISYIEYFKPDTVESLIQQINETSINNFIVKYYDLCERVIDSNNSELVENLEMLSFLMCDTFSHIGIDNHVGIEKYEVIHFGGSNSLKELLKLNAYRKKYLKYSKIY